ncbi:hypothetical protein Tco_0099540 [Tanacetum coccineum]
MKWVSEDPSYITGGELEYPRELFLGITIYGYWLQGASFTSGMVSSIPIVGSISLKGFLPPILLLVVIIVTIVIVAVILVVVVVVAIVGVVIVVAIIGVVVVVGGVSFIIKLSFMIIGFEAVTFPSILLGNPPMKASKSFSVFGTMFGHRTANSWNFLT